MAVEREAGFEAQRVARTKADRPGQGIGDDRIGQGGGAWARNRNLEPVLTGVARTADPQGLAERMEGAALHEGQLGDTRNDRIEHVDRARPLKREQRLLLHVIDHDLARQSVLEHVDVADFGGAVDDDIEIVAAPGRHQIVDDPAIIGQEQRIFELHVLLGREISRHQGLQRAVRILAVDQQLTHVADVEQPRILAGPQMLGHDAVILDRHRIAGEGDHPAAAVAVPLVERQAGLHVSGLIHFSGPFDATNDDPPLVERHNVIAPPSVART